MLGIDNILKHLKIFKDKRIALSVNHSSYNTLLESTAQIFLKNNLNVVKIFSPEHGIKGIEQAGIKVGDEIDEDSGIKIISLYGKNKKPNLNQMEDIDLVAFDIQDVGLRFYTIIYTMSYLMEACGKAGKEFVIFDRPNPLGRKVEGNILNKEYRSFVGEYPICQRYGLTIAELALMINNCFLKEPCKLYIVKMDGYKALEDFKNKWIAPSPNIPRLTTVLPYSSNYIFEGTNISEGRGTTSPFEIIGAPFLKNIKKLIKDLNKNQNIVYHPMYFKPYFSKYKNEICKGVLSFY